MDLLISINIITYIIYGPNFQVTFVSPTNKFPEANQWKMKLRDKRWSIFWGGHVNFQGGGGNFFNKIENNMA